MFGSHFYNKTTRKATAIFGKMFQEIYLQHYDNSGKVISQTRVPISYANKAKFLRRIQDLPDLENDKQVAIRLPRMSFELESFEFNQEKQLPRVGSLAFLSEKTGNYKSMFNPTPYRIGFQLHIYARTHDDALQIVEQIIPYFNQSYTITIKPIAEFDTLTEDVPIKLNSISFSDDYDGMQEQRRTIIYTLSFTMEMNYWGPVPNDGSVIRKAIVYIETEDNVMDSDYTLETITVKLDPLDTSPDSDYDIITTITLNVDSA